MSVRPVAVALVLLGASGFAACSLLERNQGQPLVCMRLALLGGTLTAAAASDLHCRRIPNRLVLPASLALLLSQLRVSRAAA